MKGKKGTTDEGGVRSPCLIRWPGKIPAGSRQTSIAGAIDLLPTLAGLAKIELKSALPLDGLDLSASLLAGKSGPADRTIFSHWSGKVSARTQTHRLDEKGKLYDMIADPGQTHDISQQQPAVAAHLIKAVEKWKSEVGVGRAKTERPYSVGDARLPLTVLPARDGEFKGQVKRSAPAPNCSYFTHWTSIEDRITWDVDVLEGGRYRAEVLYACPEADLGSEVELAGAGGSVRAVLDKANNPPARGMEHDRLPREGESYVKDFRPFPLGELTLTKGRGTLSLRAMKVAGRQVMEVRALHLERLGP
jgi:hypothetical protein